NRLRSLSTRGVASPARPPEAQPDSEARRGGDRRDPGRPAEARERDHLRAALGAGGLEEAASQRLGRCWTLRRVRERGRTLRKRDRLVSTAFAALEMGVERLALVVVERAERVRRDEVVQSFAFHSLILHFDGIRSRRAERFGYSSGGFWTSCSSAYACTSGFTVSAPSG